MAGAWIDKRRLAPVDLIMKRLLALLFLLPLVAFGQTQGTSVRALNGLATNLTFAGNAMTNLGIMSWRLGAGALGTTLSVLDTNGLSRITIAGRAMLFRDTNTIRLRIDGDSTMQFIDTAGSIQLIVGTDGMTGNGRGLTNITEAGIAVVTNTWGNAVVNFSLGTMVATNMAGDLTITGITGFNPTNLNWQTVFLTPNAAVRAVAVPADWWVSGFTNATTVSIPSSNTAILSVRCQVGIFTNASIELFQ